MSLAAKTEKPIVISVEGLCKNFNGVAAVVQVTMQIREGEIFGFLGPNGSGKTTTIRMLCGLLTPDCGSGRCFGNNIITESHAIKLNVGYMTQRFSLYEDLSIYENLDFMARLHSVADRKKTVERTIVELGLKHRSKQLAGTLSGGWKQRLALSAALLHQPKLLLLDEPTAGVDPKARRDFWEQIHRLSAQGITTLVSTHYMDEAEQCDRLAYFSQGKILIQGTEQEIIDRVALTTWKVSGENLTQLADKIKNLDGVEQVSVFGGVLHISGKNAAALKKTISNFKSDAYRWELTQSNLEDVFIHLVPNTDNNTSN